MTAAIPASELVSVQPGVIGAGGSPLSLNAVFLTNSTLVPIGQVLPFSSTDSVGAFFGTSSTEYSAASVYFGGYDNSTLKPGTLYFFQYPTASVAAYLRSATLAGMTLTQLQALSGSLSVTIDGVVKSAASINLSAASSFSNAATIIATALSATVTYNATLQTFVISSGTTGASSTIGFASGTLAAGLKLTSATGAVTSQGAVAATPAGAMAQVVAATQNWGSFMTLFEPVTADKQAFAAWLQTQNLRYVYSVWDSDVQAATSGSTTAFGVIAKGLSYEGVIATYPSMDKAAFVCGSIASLDFTRTNGRATLAYKAQSGLSIDITDAQTARNLIDNGYNFYGKYATANDQFNFFQPGQILTDWKWADSYVNQIQLNSDLQLAIVSLFAAMPSIPYNDAGYDLIKAACKDPIDKHLNFGTIRTGIPLSAAQAAQVNMQAGVAIDKTLTNVGYYLQVLPASAQVRALRQSPPCTLWYCDGGSIQKLNLASFDIL